MFVELNWPAGAIIDLQVQPTSNSGVLVAGPPGACVTYYRVHAMTRLGGFYLFLAGILWTTGRFQVDEIMFSRLLDEAWEFEL